MDSIFKVFWALSIILLFILITITSGCNFDQKVRLSPQERDILLSVAREYMQTVRYCALITVDCDGQPHVRAMDPFLPDEDMVVYLGTNPKSRKVQEIRDNPQVTLYYSDDSGEGYVAIIGTAILVDDPKQKAVWWKKDWDEFYKDQKESYLLIKVIPEKLEIVNYKHNIISDSETWSVPSVKFKIHERKD
jgi:general stress protein 26